MKKTQFIDNKLLIILVIVLGAAVLTVGGIRMYEGRVTPKTTSDTRTKTIYFAGGCFWGIEKYFSLIPGVVDVESGYAQGKAQSPTYEEVCSGKTGARETVKVVYNPAKISLDALVFAFFDVIDPSTLNAQGPDHGSQYQTGIYYGDDASGAAVERLVKLEKERISPFAVEHEKLTSFFPAEEYHQDYLAKNPGGYCHIDPRKFAQAKNLLIDAGKYKKPVDTLLKERLAPESYRVTQQAATEAPYTNKYWKTDAKGIYVDITTGEPLFSSQDKYESSCGWPAFTRTIDDQAVIEKRDTSHGMVRTEVRSRAGNAHLGHVFTDDPESPNGVRYCMNSAALRFNPFEEMSEQGYGYLKKIFK